MLLSGRLSPYPLKVKLGQKYLTGSKERQDIQHNDTHHNDIQNKDTQYEETQQNGQNVGLPVVYKPCRFFK